MRTNERVTGAGWMRDVERRLRNLEQPTLTTIPKYAGDPPHLKEGMIWVDTTAMKLKVVHGGTVRSATLT